MNYDATKDAINMLDKMTEEEYQEWNRKEGEPSYENGSQEWDD